MEVKLLNNGRPFPVYKLVQASIKAKNSVPYQYTIYYNPIIINFTLPTVSFLKNGIHLENYITQRYSNGLGVTFKALFATF